jgi:hypothetical protein
VQALLTGLGVFLGTVLISFIGAAVRARGARRRHAVSGVDGVATGVDGAAGGIPVRLCGVALTYPGFWRAGRLDPATSVWRPRGPWGVPVSLTGARIMAVRRAEGKDGLPPFARSDAVLTGADPQGAVFRVATLIEDAELVAGGLAGTPRPADPSRHRFLWLRQRVPLAILVLIVLGLLWSAYWLLPLLGRHEVDAVVETNRGSSYLCEVSWIDPAGGPGGHGLVSCDRQPGEHLAVQAMGWPRTGTADDPSSAVIMAVLANATLLLVTGLIMASQAVQRRRLARTAPGDPVHGA